MAKRLLLIIWTDIISKIWLMQVNILNHVICTLRDLFRMKRMMFYFQCVKIKIRSLGFNFYVTCINNPIDWRYTSKGILQAIRLKRRMECSIDKFEQRANRKKKNKKYFFLRGCIKEKIC